MASGGVTAVAALVAVCACTRRNPEYCELPEHCPGEICDLDTHTCVPIPDAYVRVNWIVYVTDRDGNSEIYRMRPDGSDQINLTQNPAEDTSPSWDPTGEYVSFLSDRSGSLQLFVMRLDGTEVRNLSNGEASAPAWSKDGSALAFATDRLGSSSVFRVSVNGGDPVLVRRDARSPDWSPDGRLLCVGIGTGSEGLVAVNADGTNPMQLTSVLEDDPRWSPEGARIAIGRRFVNGGVFVIDSDGTDLTDISGDTPEIESRPRWSPNGADVLVDRSDGEIVVLGAASGQYTNVTMSAAMDRAASWAADGTILFTSDRFGDDDVVVVPRGGGEPMNLTNAPGRDYDAAARPHP